MKPFGLKNASWKFFRCLMCVDGSKKPGNDGLSSEDLVNGSCLDIRICGFKNNTDKEIPRHPIRHGTKTLQEKQRFLLDPLSKQGLEKAKNSARKLSR